MDGDPSQEDRIRLIGRLFTATGRNNLEVDEPDTFEGINSLLAFL